MPPDAPRLAYPLRLHAGGATLVEQDSLDDLVSTAFFAARTPLGWRVEAPGFGINDPVFELDPTPGIVVDLERSDPRLAVLPTEQREELTLRVQLLVQTNNQAEGQAAS